MKKKNKCFLRIVFPSLSMIPQGYGSLTQRATLPWCISRLIRMPWWPIKGRLLGPTPRILDSVHLGGNQDLTLKQASRWCWYIQYRNHSSRTTFPTIVNPGFSLQLPRAGALWKVRWLALTLDSYRETDWVGVWAVSVILTCMILWSAASASASCSSSALSCQPPQWPPVRLSPLDFCP